MSSEQGPHEMECRSLVWDANWGDHLAPGFILRVFPSCATIGRDFSGLLSGAEYHRLFNVGGGAGRCLLTRVIRF